MYVPKCNMLVFINSDLPYKVNLRNAFITFKGGGMGAGRAIDLPLLFQICELGGLVSHCVNLGTQACNTTHIKADI